MCCSHQHTAYIICTHTCDYTLRNGQYGLHQRHIFLSVISKFRFVLFHFTYTRNSIQHTWAANGPTVKSHEISLDCRCCCCCFRVWAIATFVFDAGHVCVCVLCYWWVCMCACFRVWTTDKQEHSNEFTQWKRTHARSHEYDYKYIYTQHNQRTRHGHIQACIECVWITLDTIHSPVLYIQFTRSLRFKFDVSWFCFSESQRNYHTKPNHTHNNKAKN